MPAMLEAIIIFIHVVFSILVGVFVLMHSGQDSGLGSIGGGAGTGGGGQHVMERNLDRITIASAVIWVVSAVILARMNF